MCHDAEGSYYVVYGEKEPDAKYPKRIKIQQYPIANALINHMMPVVMKHVSPCHVMRFKLFQVNFHTTLSGQAVVTMIYHKKLAKMESEWKEKAALLRCMPICCHKHSDSPLRLCKLLPAVHRRIRSP